MFKKTPNLLFSPYEPILSYGISQTFSDSSYRVNAHNLL
jgi:hypothetical protein